MASEQNTYMDDITHTFNLSSYYDKRQQSVSDLQALVNSTLPCEVVSERNGTGLNNSDTGELPSEIVFNDENLLAVISYVCIFVVAACGNLTVFITLFRNRHIKSRVNQFILHLSVADLIVTFVMVPLEIIWNITVAWKAGDTACRILMFFRILGLYLSSFILVTISLDRYFAIVHPLSLNDADKRGKIMLILAWSFSFVASVPQSVIFHVDAHPKFTWFKQCVTFNFFPTAQHELAYNLFNLITLYALPLCIITASYSLILYKISKKTRECKEETKGFTTKTTARLRRSAVGSIERARIRTLKMTLVIVSVFVICWTPYFVLSAWWWFDKQSARKLDPKIQKGLFLFAVSSSCMDPIVYGMFTINFKREFIRCCCCIKNSLNHHNVRRMTQSSREPPVHYTSYANGRTTVGSVRSNETGPNSNGKGRNMSVDSAKSNLIQKTSSQSSVSTERERANVNNFMKLSIPILKNEVVLSE